MHGKHLITLIISDVRFPEPDAPTSSLVSHIETSRRLSVREVKVETDDS